jgi:hypothetical protein
LETVDPKVADFLACKTLKLPEKVPLQYTPHRDTIYVRKCYAEYYDLIMGMLRSGFRLGITITGTPPHDASSVGVASVLTRLPSYSVSRHRQVDVHGVLLLAL